jgi:hypothetical protein
LLPPFSTIPINWHPSGLPHEPNAISFHWSR